MAEQEGNSFTRTDRVFARYILYAHDHGMTTGLLLRWSLPWYLLGLIPVIPALAIMANYGQRESMVPLLGIVGWFAFVQLRMVRAQSQSWRLYEKVIDWEKVRQIAKAGSPGLIADEA